MARKLTNIKSERKRSVQSDEAALWDEMTGDVEPMGERSNRVAPDVGHELYAARRDGVERRASPDVDEQSRFLNQPNSIFTPELKADRGKTASGPAPASEVLNRRNLRRIGKGRISIDDRIDLHGMRAAQAHVALLGFLRRGQLEHFKTVLVITGKGRIRTEGPNSNGPENWMDDRAASGREIGVLRSEVPEWLRSDELAGVVAGFSKALPQHGGDGALYVRLKRLR